MGIHSLRFVQYYYGISQFMEVYRSGRLRVEYSSIQHVKRRHHYRGSPVPEQYSGPIFFRCNRAMVLLYVIVPEQFPREPRALLHYRYERKRIDNTVQSKLFRNPICTGKPYISLTASGRQSQRVTPRPLNNVEQVPVTAVIILAAYLVHRAVIIELLHTDFRKVVPRQFPYPYCIQPV